MKKAKTYMDQLMQDKDFREKFDEEYKKLCLEEKSQDQNKLNIISS